MQIISAAALHKEGNAGKQPDQVGICKYSIKCMKAWEDVAFSISLSFQWARGKKFFQNTGSIKSVCLKLPTIKSLSSYCKKKK